MRAKIPCSFAMVESFCLSHTRRLVVDALGGVRSISFRIGELLLDAMDKTGEQTIVARAREAMRLGYSTANDVIVGVVADRIPEQDFTKIRMRLGRNKRTFRVEMAELSRFMPHLSRLEDWLSTAILMFEATLVSESRVAAKEIRDTRAQSDWQR